MSEREKNELVQLVDTMVAYSVTYKNTKFEPQERANGSIPKSCYHRWGLEMYSGL